MNNLCFEETEKLLLKYKIPLCQTKLAKDKKEALRQAANLGYPLALKVSSAAILHKSDLGAVKTGIKNKEELLKAWQEISLSCKKAELKTEGILIQKMLSGTEIAMGMKRDPQFGPVLMFGLGGVFIEILKDVSFRVAPVSKDEALKMIKEIKGYKILLGYRKNPKIDIKKLAEIIVSLSRLSLSQVDIEEIDFNPLIANEQEIKVVDAKILK